MVLDQAHPCALTHLRDALHRRVLVYVRARDCEFPSLGVHQPEPDVGIAVRKKLKDPIHGAAPSALADRGIRSAYAFHQHARKQGYVVRAGSPDSPVPGPVAGPWTLECMSPAADSGTTEPKLRFGNTTGG